MTTAEKNLSMQASILQQTLHQYQNGIIDIETLRLNTSVDTAYVNAVPDNEYCIRVMKDGAFSSMLYISRYIDRINNYFSSGREATDEYIVELCEALIDHSQRNTEILRYSIAYHNGAMTETQYRDWYETFWLPSDQ